MSNFFARVGSADAYASAINNIGGRQSRLTQLQGNLTAGKRVLKPSDDPTAAAQAERAITRSAQVTIQQRALSLQKDNMSHAETVLGRRAMRSSLSANCWCRPATVPTPPVTWAPSPRS